MLFKKGFVGFLFFLLLLSSATGQQMHYINVNEGLSSRYTYGIEQDSEGFIWIATNEGIDRFDGFEFRSYKLISSNINPTELGYRFNIVTDSSKTIWAYTTSGKVFRYNHYKDEFELIFELQNELANQKALPYINKIFFDHSNTMWIGTTLGSFYVKISGNKFQEINQFDKSACFSFEEPDVDNLWAATNDGVKIFNLGGKILNESTEKSILPEITRDIAVRGLYFDHENNKLWIGSDNNGPSVYDFNKKELIDLGKLTPHVPIRNILKDKQNNILIGLDGAGICQLDSKDYKLKNVWRKTEDIPGGISDNSVLDLFCDEDGRVWVSTWSAGITIIDYQQPAIKLIEHQLLNANSIRSNMVTSIFEDSDGDIWFGTNTGVSILDHTNNRWNHLLNIEHSEEISNFKTLTICEDNRKRIWIGGYASGIHCYDKRSKTLTNYSGLAGTKYTYLAYYDGNNSMWFGGMESVLTRMDLSTNSFSKYKIKNATVAINKNEDQLWIATTNGLFIVEKKSDKVIPFAEYAGEQNKISNRYLNCLFQDNEGKLWIGTNGGGLNLYDPKKNQTAVISTNDGLPSNFIFGILSDRNNRIWLSTEKGLACYDPVANSCINIGFIDKFTNFLFNNNACNKLKSGDMVMGGLNGAIIFTPEIIKPYTSKSKLVLNEFRISYQRVYPADKNSPLQKPVNETSEIKLKYSQNSFSFRFSSINFNSSTQLVYQWKLEGFEPNWTPLTLNKTAGYTNIPPGTYTFKIRCTTRNKKEFDDERQITIKVQPPFWKSNLAFVSYFLIFSGLFWLIYNIDQNRIQKKHADDKINFFINTAHDIKTPVSLIKAPLKDLEADKGITRQGLYYLKLAQANANKLAQVVNQILDFEKVDSKKSQLVLSHNNLAAYINEKIDSYQLLADENDINFKYQIPDNEYFAMFDAAKMDNIIDNLFSNAIKYTPPKGTIELNVETWEKEWSLEISDTGIGIPKKDRKHLFKMYYRAENAINSRQSGTGIGLMLIQNLVQMHGGRIGFTSQENVGSSFTISLPRKSISERKIAKLRLPNLLSYPVKKDTLVNKGIEATQIPETSEHRVKILIVEDDYELRNYLVNTLSKQFNVFNSEDGQIALEMVQDEKFDLVISDVMLPNLRGDELCKKIKTAIETSHIPVILLTGLSGKQNTISGLEAGADYFLSKPFDIDILNACINNILKNRRLISDSLKKGINPSTEKVSINNLDKELINDILKIVERELSNPDFSIPNLCRETAMSRTLLYNKIKVHTGLSPNEFIKIVRMNKAMDLLKSGQNTIGEISDMVGFQDSKYFSTAFKKFFGKSPKHYFNATSDYPLNDQDEV
jgi:signal transduction histidine kinase/ligand-binding sensor domain-containing protein/DNA-binding response OmpR family regulator